jgi:hypothetical protein
LNKATVDSKDMNMAATPSRLRPISNVTSASWVVASLGQFGSGVGSLVPHGFEAYARLLHPAWSDSHHAVSWAEAAAWTGKVIHPNVQFGSFISPKRASNSSAIPWTTPPDRGTLPPALLRALCEILTHHTRSASRCWFCLWDGYGWVAESAMNSSTVTAENLSGVVEGNGPKQNSEPSVLPPRFPADVINGPRVSLPEREYLLLEGPLDAAGELGWVLGGRSFVPQSPNLFWPNDHTWCVATEIDLDSTYVGGSSALMEEILADRRLEALPAKLTDSVRTDRDEINGWPQTLT